jgi:uncharacterized membrane protein YccC
MGYQLGSRWTTIGEYSDLINATVFAAIGVAIVVFVVRSSRPRRPRWRAERWLAPGGAPVR